MPPVDEGDNYTGQIDLVKKRGEVAAAASEAASLPGDSSAASGAEEADKTASDEAGILQQETKPMPAVVWPPPEPIHHVPVNPPSLRKRPAPSSTGGGGTIVTGPHGVLTTELRRALPPWALPLLTAQPFSVWIAARIGITLLALLATMMIPAIAAQGTANWYDAPGGPVLNPLVNSIGGVWTRWDGQWYLKIASEGYSSADGSSAFFPLYPWLITVFGWLAGERFIWAGILLSSFFFLGALVLLHRLVRLDFHHEDAGRTVFYLAAFPMAFFFWAVYSESLFLFLSVAALLAMRTQRWWWAAVLISLAIWTRTTGLLLLLPLGWELWRAHNPPVPTDPRAMPPKRPSRWALPSLALPFASLLLFVVWSWVVFHDPLAALSAQADWNRHFSWPWQTIAGAWNVATQTGLQFQPENQSWTYLGSFVFAVIVGALALRWLRASYSIYLWAGIIFPLFSATPHNPLLSYPRFLAVLFPAFIVLALMGRNRYANQIITWVSLLLLALYTIRFANWYWVA
ncbi:MAG: mannosyltransferase family protein [Chloroflexota bacterium]